MKNGNNKVISFFLGLLTGIFGLAIVIICKSMSSEKENWEDCITMCIAGILVWVFIVLIMNNL